jgi:flagellar hook protein FlgE
MVRRLILPPPQTTLLTFGTTGFKRSRAEFGDIFATSPLQNSSSSIGSGSILKGVKQQFTQGNIAASLNALDLAISGQGFFALKPSLTSSQVVYTRNGSFNVDNNRNVVDFNRAVLADLPGERRWICDIENHQ